MPLPLQYAYSEDKLWKLHSHYVELYKFLRDHTVVWGDFCTNQSRSIFSYPYNIFLKMMSLCEEILELYGEPSIAVSAQIQSSGRRILELYNNDYKKLGLIAYKALKNGGFNLENLTKLYEDWKEERELNDELYTTISFPVFDVPGLSEISDFDDFLRLFHVDNNFLCEDFANHHAMLEFDGTYVPRGTPQSQESISVDEISGSNSEEVEDSGESHEDGVDSGVDRESSSEHRDQSGANVTVVSNGENPNYAWLRDYENERREHNDRVFSPPLSGLRRHPSLDSSLATISTIDSDEEEEQMYVPFAEGHFVVFEECLRFRHLTENVLPVSPFSENEVAELSESSFDIE